MSEDKRIWLYHAQCPQGRLFPDRETAPSEREGWFRIPKDVKDMTVGKATKKKKPSKKDVETFERIVAIIGELEVNDTNYTEGGLPRCDVLSELMGVKVDPDMRNAAYQEHSAQLGSE